MTALDVAPIHPARGRSRVRGGVAFVGACWAIASVWAQPAALTPPESAAPSVTPEALPASRRAAEPPVLTPLESRFSDRLEALTPDNAMAYLLLGEEVADAAQSREDARLATTLLVLAAALDSDRGGRVASSASFALADLATGERDRRWLVSTAKLLSPQASPPLWTRRPETPADDSVRVQLATFLGLVRSGDGVLARQTLAKPGVQRLLESYDRLLGRLGISNGAGGLEREAQRWPCPDCANELLQRRGRVGGASHLCINCAGQPGPKLSNEELVGHLRFESWLLEGAQRSWAAQVATDGGAPLIDASPGAIPQLFGIDPTRVFWRHGEWLETPDGSPLPKVSPKQPPAPQPADTATPGTSGT